MSKLTTCLLACMAILICDATITQAQARQQNGEDPAIAKELSARDGLLFNIAFSSCDTVALEKLLTADFSFFADKGLSQQTYRQTRADFLQNIKRSCADMGNHTVRMRREVVKGTMQSFLLSDAVAVQTGVQRFYRIADGKEKLVEESKFTRNWRKENGTWKLANETDFLVNTNPDAIAADRYLPPAYVPGSEELLRTVTRLDSLYFDTYNTCKMAAMDSLTAEDIEFYHDRSGISTSKKDLLASIQKNICNKVTRTLTPGSIEAYEIPGYGAVEFGYHSFRNINEPGESHPSKFVIIWRHKDNRWQIARVISLH